MSDVERGGLRSRTFAQQLRDFRGLTWGKISPTDIDAFLDFGDHHFVFVEAKHGDARIGVGQRLALERLVDACSSPSRLAVLLKASHDCSGDVPYHSLPVTRIYFKGAWHAQAKPATVREVIDRFLKTQPGG